MVYALERFHCIYTLSNLPIQIALLLAPIALASITILVTAKFRFLKYFAKIILGHSLHGTC